MNNGVFRPCSDVTDGNTQVFQVELRKRLKTRFFRIMCLPFIASPLAHLLHSQTHCTTFTSNICPILAKPLAPALLSAFTAPHCASSQRPLADENEHYCPKHAHGGMAVGQAVSQWAVEAGRGGGVPL